MCHDEGDGNKRLTNGQIGSENQSNLWVKSSDTPDPRLVALVRFLARQAAEKDYAQLIESSRLTQRLAGDKERN